MVLREGVSLHDDRRAGLAIVAGRGNGHQVTASHMHQTRRPTRSTAARRARDQDQDWRPASPPVVAPPASGHRLPRGAVRAILVRASAAASSSSSRLAVSLDFCFRNALQCNALRTGRKNWDLFQVRRAPRGQPESCSNPRYSRGQWAVFACSIASIIAPWRSSFAHLHRPWRAIVVTDLELLLSPLTGHRLRHRRVGDCTRCELIGRLSCRQADREKRGLKHQLLLRSEHGKRKCRCRWHVTTGGGNSALSSIPVGCIACSVTRLGRRASGGRPRWGCPRDALRSTRSADHTRSLCALLAPYQTGAQQLARRTWHQTRRSEVGVMAPGVSAARRVDKTRL